ncbi:mucin-5B-like [Rhodamnia argentea]|uniref:Mucin-5B-like n=1 Tax=Rhodamnia argentea TaxID=178133 RepID=A0ABM3HBT9_9MYRT|nr:mucin-5B-like [Rhodamnia argentea]
MANTKITACVLVVVVAFLSSAEAANYTVGGSGGWKIPSSAGSYSDWVSQHTFEVGDVLVFDFDSSTHDVADVTKEDYDACNTDSPFTVMSTSPAAYSLDSAGDYYLLCTSAGHCSQGQKLAVTVAQSSSGPTSSPPGSLAPPTPTTGATASPSSVGQSLGVAPLVLFVSILMGMLCEVRPHTTHPTKSLHALIRGDEADRGMESYPNMAMVRRSDGVVFAAVVAMVTLLWGSAAQLFAPPPGHPKGPITYTVGDTMGWTKPAGGAAVYQAWASNNLFEVGDILVFNFNNGAHDVAEVTKAAFDSCNGANTLSISTVPPGRITLTTAGQHFFICTVPGHCSSGQKVAINVTAAGSSATPPPSSSVAPTPKAATPYPSLAPPPTSTAAPTLSPSASTPSSPAATPRTSAVTPAPSTASLPPKAAIPSPSATLPPSSTAAPPSSTPAPSVATSPAGVATPPVPGNSAASLGVAGVSAAIWIAAVALFTFP